ncbi:9379_t:CDS:2 [Funneliformis mosseae]|uniref:9379_t:CDS:1 n=1 Tax=Funneliformis mosseae TaxID=27381 RepID=A0A9N9DXW2_FUNMO|nr:9379_t:CDS:2 [Funneliformis mosseae]
MDIRNYMWVNSFEITSANLTINSDPSTTQSSLTTSIIVVSNNSNSELITMKIIIASIGGTQHNLPGSIVENKRSSNNIA